MPKCLDSNTYLHFSKQQFPFKIGIRYALQTRQVIRGRCFNLKDSKMFK